MSILSRLFGKTPKAIENPASTFSDLQKHMNVNQYLRDSLASANATILQMKFLLDCAPMTDMIKATDIDAHTRLAVMRSPFAYIHPKTLAQFDCAIRFASWVCFPGSLTKWIPMSSMPEGRVIFSPLQVPGLEKLLVESCGKPTHL